MTSKHLSQQGFTLTELMLAMSFVTFLLLFMVTATVQTLRLYNKGVSIRYINQTGRQVSEEMTRTLRYSTPSQVMYAEAEQRLCANGVAYVWNKEDDSGLVEVNYYTGADAATPIRLIRVDDKDASLCSNPSEAVVRAEARDLISGQLSVRGLTVQIEESGRVVTVVTTVATQGANKPHQALTPTGFECPAGGDGAFCAFGQFHTTVYIRN